MALPEYDAVSVWDPVASVDVTQLAVPDESATAEQSVAAPSVNVTVPVGGVPLPATVAVIVTLWPEVEGCGVEPTVTVGLSLLTVCATEPEALPYVESPE